MVMALIRILHIDSSCLLFNTRVLVIHFLSACSFCACVVVPVLPICHSLKS